MSKSVPSTNLVNMRETTAAITKETAADHTVQRPRYRYANMVSSMTATHDSFTDMLKLLMKIHEARTPIVNMPIDGNEKPAACEATIGRVERDGAETQG